MDFTIYAIGIDSLQVALMVSKHKFDFGSETFIILRFKVQVSMHSSTL